MYLPNRMLFIGPFLLNLLVFTYAEDYDNSPMPKEEREQLKDEARDMFYHAYRAYMENAYPADELMPLSCKGRYRGITPNRGDMDDILGNFSLTLVDSLDTLVILGDFEEFEHAVKLVIQDVSFDSDIVVSVFETNIRMLGGLLSAHILALGLQESGDYLTWYRGELLALAHDIGKRLLPAFNTSTGIPHARINLRHGMLGLENSRETCTACAGTMILEMAALSRLTGEPIFEHKAHKAMDRLWKIRHRSSDLMGTVMNIHSGDWIRKESGVGAGIDSYYEYCLKAYILLGDETYLARFYRHYNAVMKYVSRGPMMFDVHMHRPHTQSRHFMDALLAFWPGLQVLLGDVRPAVETHEMLYQVMQRHTFIPEAFTADFQVHWGQHPLRPEFLESTYFLHRATNDDHYLRVGKAALKSLQKHTRVPCGYAAVNDVRTRIHEDRMDSFVLAETFKYLYMMFADDAELPVNLDEFILTTEAHLLPLSLAGYNRNVTSDKSALDDDRNLHQYSRTCPNTLKLLPASVRKPLKNMMGECRNHVSFRRLLAKQFRPADPEHIHTLSDMGISVLTLIDGRVQLLHTFSMAKSARDAEEGLIFMREMAELSERSAAEAEGTVRPRAVGILTSTNKKILAAGPAHFGPELQGAMRVESSPVFANPLKACSFIQDIVSINGKIAIAERGDCTFAHKVKRLQTLGAVGVIIIDNIPGSSKSASPLFAMSGDGANDVTIPAVFLFSDDAIVLKNSITQDPNVRLVLGDMTLIESEKADLKLEKDRIFDKSSIQFKLDEVKTKITPDSKKVLVSYEPKMLYQTVTGKNPRDMSDSNSEAYNTNQKRYHWLNSIISELDSQFYNPVLAVKDATKHNELEGSKETLNKAVTKLLEDMKGMIYKLGGVTVNKGNNNLEGTINPTADEDLNIQEIYKVLQANKDDNIIVRNSGDLDYNVLLGKLADQIEKVSQRINTLKKIDAIITTKDSIEKQEVDVDSKITLSDDLVKSASEEIDLNGNDDDDNDDDDDEFHQFIKKKIPSR